jgi:hypothetical protein
MFKKNKISFYSTIDGVEKVMPIIKSKDYSHQWIKEARSTMTKETHSHVLRCPGIRSSLNQGWLIRTWQDIEITLEENGKYSWSTPIDMRTLSSTYNETQLVVHHENDFFNYRLNWPQNTFSKIIKINMPWTVKVPKGYLLYQVHPFYLDENRFSVLPACYSSEYGLARIIVPMLWHSLKGKFLINAGTPVAQVFLVKQENFDIEMSSISDNMQIKKYVNVTMLSLRNRFVRNYLKIKEIFNKNDF